MGKTEKPDKKRKIWPWIIVAIIVLAIFGSLNSGSDDKAGGNAAQASKSERSDASESKVESFTIGQEFTAGDWTVTIDSMDEPVKSVGTSEFSDGATAQGQFIPVTLSVTNAGEEASTFFASDVKLIDDQGREFEYSSDASIWGIDDGGLLLDEVNPGNTLKGKIWFDVPEATNVTELTISSGFLSSPISVKIK